jgi:hypothetical protein
MLALIAATLISSSGKATAQPVAKCAVTKEFHGTAPSDIVQQTFAAHFTQPLNRVDCRDNGFAIRNGARIARRQMKPDKSSLSLDQALPRRG